MALLKTYRVLRNNWKKSAIGSLILFYSGKYAVDSYNRHQLMRAYCESAKAYGDSFIPVNVRPRHITVILNPAANRRKAKKEFEDYCAPLLHLAGISVNVILTEGEGQARSLAEKLEEPTDAVVVAGGDGTLSEVVTGIMRRKDGVAILKRIPMGVLPLGKTNTIAHQLFMDSTSDHTKHLAEATMAVIREFTQPLDVIKFQVLPTGNEVPGKPVFSVAGLQWGAFRDAYANREKYWYFGALRGYASYIFTGLKGSDSGVRWLCEAQVELSPPCQGCSKCFSERPDLQPEESPRQSWWSVFGKKNANAGLKKQSIDYKSIRNEECSKSVDLIVSTADLSLSSRSLEEQSITSPTPYLKLSYSPSNFSYSDFIREGWRRESGHDPTRPVTCQARQVKIWPKHFSEGSNTSHSIASEGWVSIDSEDYEEKALQATLLPCILKIFCSSKMTLS